MKMNCFESEKSIEGIEVNFYSVSGIGAGKNISDNYREVWKLCYSYDGMAVPCKKAGEIMTIERKQERIKNEDLVAKYDRTEPLELDNPLQRSAMEDVIKKQLRNRFYRIGYKKDGQRFIPKSGRTVKGENGEPLLLYENGCELQVELLESGYILVWIDPKCRIKQKAIDYLNWKKNRSTKKLISKYLHGKKVFVEPYSKTGKIDTIEWNKTNSSYKFEAANLKSKLGKDQVSLEEYWKAVHNIDLDGNEGPILKVKFEDRNESTPYPPSKVYISTKDKNIPRSVRKNFSYASIKRVSKTEKIAKKILDEPISLADFSISFKIKMASDKRLKDVEKIEKKGKLNTPSILFGNTKRSDDPRDLSNHGPFSGEKTISVHYVYPENSRIDVDKFHEVMSENYTNLKFGKLEMIDKTEVKYSGKEPSRNDYSYSVGNAIDQINKGEEEYSNPIIISIIPGNEKSYVGGKQGAHDENFSIQTIKVSTALDISSEKRYYKPKAFNTLSQIYLKCLNKGEAPWILEYPASGDSGTAYIGYDVSRRYDKEKGTSKEAAATISMVDDLGRHMTNEFYTSQSGETMDKPTASRLVFDLTREANKTFQEYGNDFERMVIFKDGIVRSNESENIKKGIEESINDIVSKSALPDNIEVELISVVKSNIERIYKDNGYNPDRGQYIIFTNGSAVISTSELIGSRKKNVTVQTTRIDPKFIVNSQETKSGKYVDTEKIIKEFNNLCFLDWGSLYCQSKYPIVLTLVQKLGEQYTLDIDSPDYLPL